MNGPDNLLDAPVRAAALPEVRNHTRFPSQYYQMMDVTDQVFHVMVARLTYDMQQADDEGLLLLADEQTPLAETDRYYGAINQLEPDRRERLRTVQAQVRHPVRPRRGPCSRWQGGDATGRSACAWATGKSV